MDVLATIQLQLRRYLPALPHFGRLLLEPTLLLLLLALLAGSLLLYRLPIDIPVRLGEDGGRYNDAPFVQGFHNPERHDQDRQPFRWSSPQAALRFDNLPDGIYYLTLTQLSGAGARLLAGPHPVDLPVFEQPRRLSLLVPSQQQSVVLAINAQPLAEASDPRSLGLALAAGRLRLLVHDGVSVPWRLLTAMALLLALAWLAPRVLGARRREALLISTPLLLGLLAAIAADPVRLGLAPYPLLMACLLGSAALPALLLLPLLARRLGVPLEDPWRRWLVLATAAVFVLALAARFYPGSMHGDIHFHLNRFTETLSGSPLLVSRHRGIDFPYPPALYLLLLPLAPLVEPGTLLQASAAVMTALGLPAIFFLVRRMVGSERAALASALLYGLLPVSYMPVWWSFDTHIFAQFLAVLASGYIAWNFGRLHRPRIWLGLLGLLLLVFLGHFGFFLNMTLLCALLVVVSWFRFPEQRRQLLALGLMLGVAGALSWLLFYSAYIELFLQHAQAFAEGGMNAINDRQPTAPSAQLWVIANHGFWQHYALLPLLLAPVGLVLLARTPGRSKSLALIAGLTFCVSAVFASLPLLTASTISTRWLSFSAWPLAICSGVAVDMLWRRGRLPRLLAVTGFLFVGGCSLRLWLLAMAYHIRPPEPF